MARVALPIQEAVRDLTADLFDRGAAVDKALVSIEPDDVGAVVSYREDDGRVAIVAVFDRELVGIMGGALVMVPTATLAEARRRGRVPDNLYENFWEVANILASTLNRPGGPHVVLADRLRSLGGIEPGLQAVLDAPAKSRAFDVTVDGYGTGRMALYAV